MNYSEIKRCDIANGVGARTSVFVSGCRHRCDGCFNSVAWEFDSGSPFTDRVERDVIESMGPPYISGLSILGGEPLEPENQPRVLGLLERARAAYPDKTVWMWTGFTFEELTGGESRACTEHLDGILNLVDVLVDGRFVEEERDIMLRFRGSANQRIIDMRKSLSCGTPVEWTDGPVFGSHSWGACRRDRKVPR